MSPDLDGGFAATQDFNRLFMVPGMGHCAGVGTAQGTAGVSPAANANSVPLPAPTMFFGARRLGGERHRAGDDRAPVGRCEREPLLCPYPQKPTYIGTGAINAAASYTCK